MRLLEGLGYLDLRHYGGGLADWQEHGLPLEQGPGSGERGAPARPERRHHGVARRRGTASRLIDGIAELSSRRLLGWFLAVNLGCGVVYWLAGNLEGHGLQGPDGPLSTGFDGLPSALYCSFVTATTLGYGDLAPLGASRILAVLEAATGLLVFGALVSKFVSRRQERLVEEMHRITWEERLGRVQGDLHGMLIDLQSLAQLCAEAPEQARHIRMRLEGAIMVFASQLRTVHDLLWRPEREVEEEVLEAILASLAAALEMLSGVLTCAPPLGGDDADEPSLRRLRNIERLAAEICGECVPRSYAPHLSRWMNRTVELSRGLGAAAAAPARHARDLG